MDSHDESGEEKVPRPPEYADLTRICAELNRRGARYVVVGGFAIIHHGFQRLTQDIDLLIETTHENEAKVIEALLILPDRAAAELKPGEIGQYGVVRVGDEVMIDLMKTGCGVTYHEAIQDAVYHDVNGVRIPFASARTLWRMKQTVREKDVPDRHFLRELLASEGIKVEPSVSSHAASLDGESTVGRGRRMVTLIRILLMLIGSVALALFIAVVTASIYKRMRYPGIELTDGLLDIGLVFIFGFIFTLIIELVAWRIFAQKPFVRKDL